LKPSSPSEVPATDFQKKYPLICRICNRIPIRLMKITWSCHRGANQLEMDARAFFFLYVFLTFWLFFLDPGFFWLFSTVSFWLLTFSDFLTLQKNSLWFSVFTACLTDPSWGNPEAKMIHPYTSVIWKPTFLVPDQHFSFLDQFPNSICHQYSETSKLIESVITRESCLFSVEA